jgi:homoserine O-acetyltransferase/O-succinyltransferase
LSIDDYVEPRGKSVGVVATQSLTFAEPPNPMQLESGQTLGPVTLAYETYGQLNAARDNAVLVVHALTGDAHVAGFHRPEDTKAGWWDVLVGPEKPLDTDRYFVICSNLIGGCKGSTGPSTTNPATGKPYATDFPVVTINDMVRAEAALIDHLGIERLLTVIGGSMGGMQVLEWALAFGDRVASIIPVATAARLSAQGIAFDEVGRQAIMKDPTWNGGHYYDTDQSPVAGLSVARMIGHITYLSEASMREKFGRRLQNRAEYVYDFSTEFQVESYLRYQGDAFIKRFDANSYLYITKAMDYYDPATSYGDGSLVKAFERMDPRLRTLVVSFSSDWLFPTAQSKEIVKALKANGLPTASIEIRSDYGHDTFLLPNDQFEDTVRGFLRAVHDDVQLASRDAGKDSAE